MKLVKKNFFSFTAVSVLFLINSCGFVKLPKSEGPLSPIPSPNHVCKLQTIIDGSVEDYKITKEEQGLVVRVAVLPYFVPESFSHPGVGRESYGDVIARDVTSSLLKNGAFHIVEFYPIDSNSISSSDYYSGNHKALDLAQRAGFNAIVIGAMDTRTIGRTLTLQTKLIDVASRVTIWSGEATVSSSKKPQFVASEFLDITRQEPSILDLGGATKIAASCLVEEGLSN